MKKITAFRILLAITSLITLSNCGGDDGPSVAEVTTKKLMAHPWHTANALVNGVDKTSVYSGLSLTFAKSAFTATNITPSWPISGTWVFVDKEATLLKRDDDLEIEILEITEDRLKISYTWNSTTFKPGRVTSVSGNHILTFAKSL